MPPFTPGFRRPCFGFVSDEARRQVNISIFSNEMILNSHNSIIYPAKSETLKILGRRLASGGRSEADAQQQTLSNKCSATDALINRHS